MFPNLILYSSLTLRESYIVFFLLISFVGIVKFIRNIEIAKGSFVKKMNGADPSSIIGLPLIKLTEYLKRFGYDVLG